MRCPTPRRLRWLALLLLPPALWGAVLAIVPTDWARTRLVARLEAATGRSVRLQALRLGTWGGVRLRGLEIGERGSDQSPWLRVEELRMDLNLAGLVSGQRDPKEVEAFGVTLRVHRRADGAFEIGDLLRAGPTTRGSNSAGSDVEVAGDEVGCSVNFRLRGGKFTLRDDPTQTRIELAAVEAKGTWQRHLATIQEMKGTLNGGRFELTASLDRQPDGPAFEVQVRAEDVALGESMDALHYLLPVLSGGRMNVEGRLGLDLYARGRGASAKELRDSLVGRGDVAMEPIRLDGTGVTADLVRALNIPEDRRTGSIRSHFQINRGRIATKDMTLTVAQMPIILSGWTDFDGRVDYHVRSEALLQNLPAEVHGMLAELSLRASDLAGLRVTGTVDHPGLSVGGVALGAHRVSASGKGHQEDRDRLHELTRRLRQRVLR